MSHGRKLLKHLFGDRVQVPEHIFGAVPHGLRTIAHSVFFTELLHHRLHQDQVVPRHHWTQVMFDLEVQPPREPPHEAEAVVFDVARGGALQAPEVWATVEDVGVHSVVPQTKHDR